MFWLVFVLLLKTCTARATNGGVCPEGMFRDTYGECSKCTVCVDSRQKAACSSIEDTICVSDDVVDVETAHRRRIEEETELQSMREGRAYIDMEMSRMESLVYEWQVVVFIISLVMTAVGVGTCVVMLVWRAQAAVRKGMDDYTHLLNRGPHHRVMDNLDQGTLAYANFDHTKIGPRADDSPYGPGCSTVCSKPPVSFARGVHYTRLPQTDI